MFSGGRRSRSSSPLSRAVWFLLLFFVLFSDATSAKCENGTVPTYDLEAYDWRAISCGDKTQEHCLHPGEAYDLQCSDVRACLGLPTQGSRARKVLFTLVPPDCHPPAEGGCAEPSSCIVRYSISTARILPLSLILGASGFILIGVILICAFRYTAILDKVEASDQPAVGDHKLISDSLSSVG